MHVGNANVYQYKGMFVESRGWFETAHYIFIAMEAIELRDLSKHLKEPLLEDEARCISSQLLRGLVNLHENGFVHRDLNPNVSAQPATSVTRKSDLL